MANQDIGIWNVPDEVLVYILSLISPYRDLHSCAQVCRQWRGCVQQVIHQRKATFKKAFTSHKLIWTKAEDKRVEITKRYSHSAVYDETDNVHSVFVFGGCTSTSTTFNDLWKLDTTTREWSRPLSTGVYPNPKACASLVKSKPGELMLFGGWTHPSPYPLHQSWRLFNELHTYDISSMRWTLINPASPLKPPTMAGHSATVHKGQMIVFGGLQKQRANIGQFSSSNDVWSFHMDSQTWTQEDIPEPRPKPRYGQSQLYLDENHLLVLGGCGGPSNIHQDVWLLDMQGPHWKWIECEVRNAEHGSSNMWCHPACKVGQDYAVVLGKNIHPKSPQNDHVNERWNLIPQARRGLNRGYGAIRRPNPSVNPRRRPFEPDDDSTTDDAEMQSEEDDQQQQQRLAVDPVGSSSQMFRSSVHLQVNQDEPSTSRQALNSIPISRRPIGPPTGVPRMQAFAVGVSSMASATGSEASDQPPSAKRKQIEMRQRQLASLRKMEERCRKLDDEAKAKAKEPRLNLPGSSSETATKKVHQCGCHRLSMFVLDISKAISDHYVEWLSFWSNNSLETPEMAILYSLVEGRGELIMFGGIQKDVSNMNNVHRGQVTENDSVTNALYFLTPPCPIV